MDHDERLNEYLRVRETRMELNTKLTRQLSKKILRKGARKLGLLVDGVLVFETEDETSVLADYCIHDCREMGRNAVDRCLARPGLTDEERRLLQAMKAARFSLFQVTEIAPGVGVETLDLLRREPVFILDIGFSESAVSGMILASRIIPVADCFATTGAALPLDREIGHTILNEVSAAGSGDLLARATTLSQREQSDFTATVLRACWPAVHRSGFATSFDSADRSRLGLPMSGRPRWRRG